MPENKMTAPGKPNETLRWKIFLVYMGASLGLILGLNGILIINNNKLFGNQSFLVGVVLIGIIYIILSILVWLLIKKILSPLNELIKNVQIFLEGNWEQRVYLQNNDETGILAEQFNVILDEMVNLYVSQEKSLPTAEPANTLPSPLTPILAKMDAAQDSDELLRVTINEINREMQANKTRLILLTDEANSKKTGFVEVVKGNGHGAKDPII